MLNSYNILIVDDSRSLRMVIKKLVENTSYFFENIYEAGDGVEALNILKDNKINLVFTDINMPNMNGLDLIQNMKDQGYKVPIVVISTEGNQETVVQAIKNGAKGYIKKPFSAQLVEEQMEKLLPK